MVYVNYVSSCRVLSTGGGGGQGGSFPPKMSIFEPPRP